MTLAEFSGCSLIAFGPALAMFMVTIAKDPIRIIILISAAFFWLLSLLLSSFAWSLISRLSDTLAIGVVLSVLFQEGFRYIFYSVLRHAEVGLQKVSEVGTKGPVILTSRLTLSYVSGLGFGVMSGVFSSINVLADSAGPGTVGLHGDSPYFFALSAFFTLAFVLLHVFWGIIFFKGVDAGNCNMIGYVLVTHLLVSLMSLVNQQQLYWLSLSSTYVVTLVTGGLAFHCAGGSANTLKNLF